MEHSTPERQMELHELSAVSTALNRVQAVIEFDLHGIVLHANDNFLQALGYTLDDGERLPVPAVLLQQAGAALRGCMTEAVDLPGRGMLMLIDLGRLCEHVALEVAA
ncbi:MAG: hypothetical protein KGL61_19505 [Burkholderiales bacterium]|nr:hypothetical protein [Burkholderiales bacterium]